MGRRSAILTVLVLLFIAVFCWAREKGVTSDSTAQQPAQPQSSATSQSKPDETYKSATVLKFTTRLVVVDVIAVDIHGKPVTDLQAKDFSLDEDGKEQQVKLFSFQSSALPGTAGASAQTPAKPQQLAPNVFSNTPRFNPTRPLNVLLLDALNTRTAHQSSAKEQMLKFIDKLPPDQPVAVYAMGTKLHLLQDFTTDPALLKKAVKSIGGSKNSPLLDKPAGGTGTFETASGAQEFMQEQMIQQVQAFAQENATMQTDLRVQLTMAALASVGRSLAGYPGRKNLIWLSESFPLVVLPNNNDSIRSNTSMRDYSSQFDKTATILTDAQVAVYPVDVGELLNNAVFSSLGNTDSNGQYLGRTVTGRGIGSSLERNEGYGKELDKSTDDMFNSHTTMNELADRTGGKAYYNRNDVTNAISKSIDDGASYYTLGYYPDNKNWNGAFRKIHVKVNRPGVKVRYRAGYFAVDPHAYASLTDTQRAQDFGIALSLDFPTSTALLFQAKVRPPSEETKNKVIINYAVEPQALNFDLGPDGLRHASVDCGVEIYSKKGETVGVHGNSSTAKMTDDQFNKIIGSYFPCTTQFDLAPGDYVLRLAVRDPSTGLIGSTNASLRVPAAARTESKPTSN